METILTLLNFVTTSCINQQKTVKMKRNASKVALVTLLELELVLTASEATFLQPTE